MKRIKTFEKFRTNKSNNDINILLDVSGSISEEMIDNIISDIYLSGIKYNNINLIQFSHLVEDFTVLSDINDIKNIKLKSGGGTIIQSAIDFLVNNNLNNNKTYIVSDFYCEEPDYSKLSDYELISVNE